MAKQKKDEVISKLQPTKFDIKYFLPILCIVGIVPLIFMGKVFIPEGIEFQYWAVSTHLDVFTYYKSVWFLIFTVILICIFVFLVLSKKLVIKRSSFYIFLGIYTALVLLSALLSQDIGISFRGFINSYMGAPVWICFALLLFMTYNMVTNEKEIMLIFKIFAFSSIIMCIIGIPQYFGYDIFTNPAVVNFYTPSNVTVDPNSLYYADESSIYATFGHSNYVGNYSVLILPVIFILFLIEKNMKFKIIYGIGIVGNLFLLLGSQSRAGYVGFFVCVLIGMILFRKYIFQYKKLFAGLVVVGIVSAGVLNFVSDGAILKQIMSINPFIDTTGQFRFEEVSIDGNACTIVTNENTLKLDFSNNTCELFDEAGNKLEYTNPDGNLTINDPRYTGYTIMLMSDDGSSLSNIQVRYNGSYDLNLSFINGSLYARTGTNNYTNDVPNPQIMGFKNNETFASARGYIWSRSLPLLFDDNGLFDSANGYMKIRTVPPLNSALLIGYGPDMFIPVFPQNDITGKLNGYQTSVMLVSKAHNMLLQMAMNSGVVSVIAYLCVIVLYLKGCLMYFRIKKYDVLSYCGAAVCLSVIGFLISGSFNDTLIYAGPIYWMFIGLGFAVNEMVKRGNGAEVGE